MKIRHVRYEDALHLIDLMRKNMENIEAAGKSRDGVVGTATRLRAGQSGPRIPIGARDFSSPKRPGRLQGPTDLLLSGYRSFPRGKSGRCVEVDHSPASSAKVKNEWCCTFASPI